MNGYCKVWKTANDLFSFWCKIQNRLRCEKSLKHIKKECLDCVVVLDNKKFNFGSTETERKLELFNLQ